MTKSQEELEDYFGQHKKIFFTKAIPYLYTIQSEICANVHVRLYVIRKYLFEPKIFLINHRFQRCKTMYVQIFYNTMFMNIYRILIEYLYTYILFTVRSDLYLSIQLLVTSFSICQTNGLPT